MEANKIQWKRIAKGEKLPCTAMLMKEDGTIITVATCAGVVVGQDAYYLPVEELRSFPKEESDDERIRKELIDFVKSRGGFKQEYIAWLEKQGEHAKFRDSIQVGDKVTRNQDGVLVNLSQLERVAKPAEKQGEQKPAWSEEDEARFESCIKVLQASDGHDTINTKWLKSLKDRVQPQNKWKESLATTDLENSLCDIQDGFSDTSYEYRILGEAIEFIRCTEPKPQWNPSDEQMLALDSAIHCYAGISPTNNREVYALEIMKEQLKKLREE